MRTNSKDISKEKENGRFYTPGYMVDNILNLSSYYGTEILEKHVIDNSCGDGAFLCRIVARYCDAFLQTHNDKKLLKSHLETFIHGIEIEVEEQQKCVANLSRIAQTYGIENVNWDILCADAMNTECFDNRMDYVLGNPPYVRVHNLGDNFNEIKKFSFSQNGMTDMFIVFFELGLKMLRENGVLGYITPSSYFSSIAGSYMRNYLVEQKILRKIVDLQHFQAFSATTYTAITVLQKNNDNDSVDYYRFDNKNLIPYYVDTLTQNDYFVSGDYYFASKNELSMLSEINRNVGKSDVYVKNGYATLCDPVFISDFAFDSDYVIPVVKASKGIKQKIFFPYDKKGSLVSEAELKKEAPLYQYLIDNKDKLLNRSNEKDKAKYWYSFGRSQAISDTFCDKMAINSLLRDEQDFKFTLAPSGTGVYGGLYIVSKTIAFSDIIDVLKTKEFLAYIALLGKYKSGGYYTFSSKDVKKYLDYKFAYIGGLLC